MKVEKTFKNGDTATARFDVWNASGRLISMELFITTSAAKAMALYEALRVLRGAE